MGLAASQARLLTITARLADNELRSQTINNAKMRLATQSSQASENYINALNNATYKFTNYDLTGGLVSQPLTFNALTAYSPYNTQYGLVNAAGELLVSENEAKLFLAANGNLDAYLKSHHLVYDTTYFDGMNFENKAYPSPFNALDEVTLKKYFEAYDSYESSMEVDEYNKNYTTFVAADKEIKKYGSKIMEAYLTKPGSSPQLNESSGNFSLGGLTGSTTEMKNALIAAFNNANNPYCLDALFNAGYINENTKNECLNIMDSIQPYGNGLRSSIEVAMTKSDPNDLGQITYTIADGIKIVIDGNTGLGVSIDHSALDADEADLTNGTYEWQYPSIDIVLGQPLSTIISSIRYKEEYTVDGNTVTTPYTYSYNSSTGQVTKYSTTTDPNVIKSAFDNVVNNIINSILSNANYTTFCQDLKNNPGRFNLPADLNFDGKSLDEILKNFQDALQQYVVSIFGEDNYEAVMNDINAGNVEIPMLDENGQALDEDGDGVDDTRLVRPDELQDIEFVLQYMRTSGYTPSDNFLTVIKEFIIDNLIDEYGSPKYAWVDENDKSTNQENADAKAQWYTNLFKRMQKGFKALENGLASSKEWIEYALESGTVYMEQVDGSFAWNALDYKTCSRITEETDDRAVARAEAEYNRAMNDIKAKDNIYDLELKNIDTEHNALQTEYDVIKGVISKNIERNFKFNQSA